MSNEESVSPALAQMIHQTHLFTWLVRTAGKVLAILVLTPLAFGVIGAVVDPDGGGGAVGAGLGAVLSVITLAVWLPTASAPFPSADVTALLDADQDA